MMKEEIGGYNDQTSYFPKKGCGILYLQQSYLGFNCKTMHLIAVEGGSGLEGGESNLVTTVLFCKSVLQVWGRAILSLKALGKNLFQASFLASGSSSAVVG